MQYVQDYDETYTYRGGNNGTGSTPSWRQVIFPYVKSTQLFKCPSNSQRKPMADAAGTGNGTFGTSFPQIQRSYGISGWVAGDTAVNQALNLSDIQSPAGKILVSESTNEWTDFGRPGWNNNAGTWDQGFAGHLGQVNFIFCDGHVKSMKPTATVSTDGPVNMWGATDGGGKAIPVGCTDRSINCDGADADLLDGMPLWERKGN